MCHNIIELHKKIEKQITHILNSTNELKEKQIKGESHLLEPIDAMEFITKKFDTYEQEKKEREEIINNLKENVSRLAQKVNYLSGAVRNKINAQGVTTCYYIEALKRNKKILTTCESKREMNI